MRLGKILFFLWLWALAQGAQAVAVPSKSGAVYDELVSAASFEYWDQDAQLLYLRARWYDPRIGRFISADPFQGKQRDPRSLNRYAYAHSDPVHNGDPSGRFSITDVGASGLLNTLSPVAAATGTRMVTRALLGRLAAYIAVSAAGTYWAFGKIKDDLQECIESARRGEHKCRSDEPTFFLGDDTPEVRDHVGDAMGSPRTLHRAPSHGRWYAQYIGPGLPCSGASGTQCDEYPFNATEEGGPDHYPETVSLRSVSQPDNSRAGGYLGAFYGTCGVSQGKRYKVAAVRGIPNGGYICGR